MHDQNSIGDEAPSVKYQRALDLFTESVLKPDSDLRGCAHNQGCYDDLMEIREHVLKYLKTLKEVTYHTNPDESDEIETQKLIQTKPLSKVEMSLKINQNDNGSFTVEWDKKDPDWMFLNQLTSEQIQDMISEVIKNDLNESGKELHS